MEDNGDLRKTGLKEEGVHCARVVFRSTSREVGRKLLRPGGVRPDAGQRHRHESFSAARAPDLRELVPVLAAERGLCLCLVLFSLFPSPSCLSAYPPRSRPPPCFWLGLSMQPMAAHSRYFCSVPERGGTLGPHLSVVAGDDATGIPRENQAGRHARAGSC